MRFSLWSIATVALASVLSSTSYAEEKTVSGYLIDNYCWKDLKGIALDTGVDLKMFPQKHTVHCLIDAPPCIASGYALVEKPEGKDKYEVIFELDEAGNKIAKEELEKIPEADRKSTMGFTLSLLVMDDGTGKLTTKGLSMMDSKMEGMGSMSQMGSVGEDMKMPSDGEITVSGYLVDNYCWEDLKGLALDTGVDLKIFPEQHTVHCMIDAPPCKAGGYAILYKPEGAEKYEVKYKLDDAGNKMAMKELEKVPAGDRTKTMGFNFTITGMDDGSGVLKTSTQSVDEDISKSDDESSKDSAAISLMSSSAATFTVMLSFFLLLQ